MTKSMLTNPDYDPVALLDWAIHDLLKCRNDAGLCKLLDISAPTMSKMRNKRIPMGPLFVLVLHEASGVPTKEIKRRMVRGAPQI